MITNSFIPVTLCFAAGVAWARLALVPEPFAWMMVIVLATRLLLVRSPGRTPYTPWLILPLFFLLGGIHAAPRLQPPADPSHIYHHFSVERQAVVSGLLVKAPEIGGGKSRLTMQVENVRFPEQRLAVSGLLRLSMAGDPPAGLEPGRRFMAKASLSRIAGFGVPGAFDYRSYMANKGILVSGWIGNPLLVTPVYETTAQPFSERLAYWPERIRSHLGALLDSTLSPVTAGVYKALLIGDRAAIDPQVLENYKAAGVVHLLAISGMHMGLLALVCGLVAAWLLARSERLILCLPVRKAAALCTLPALACYALIAGFHTPVLRALIMTSVFLAAILADRQWSIVNNIAIAALILLVINPLSLFTASFQLSFAAVSAIALIFPQLSSLLSLKPGPSSNWPAKFKGVVLASLLISLAASLGTAPLLGLHFNRISLFSPLSTLLVEPFLCLWSLTLGLLGALLAPFPTVAGLLWGAGSLGIEAANHLTELIATMPGATLWLPAPAVWAICGYYALLLTLFGLTGFRGRGAVVALLIVLSAAYGMFVYPGQEEVGEEQVRVSVLDVGQGLAQVVELPGGRTVVIDGGRARSGPGSTFDVGRDLIAPFLWKKRITRISDLVVSHGHSDHYSGLPFLIKEFRPHTVWLLGGEGEDAGYAALLHKAAEVGEIKEPKSGDFLYKDGGVALQVLSALPMVMDGQERQTSRARDMAVNNRSLLLKLTSQGTSFLFPGDVEREAEEQVVKQGADLKARVLVAPHHGSATSSSPAFVEAVSPQYVVVSAAAGQWGRFPAAEVVDRYQKSGATVLTTANSGTIVFRAGSDLQVSTFR